MVANPFEMTVKVKIWETWQIGGDIAAQLRFIYPEHAEN